MKKLRGTLWQSYRNEASLPTLLFEKGKQLLSGAVLSEQKKTVLIQGQPVDLCSAENSIILKKYPFLEGDALKWNFPLRNFAVYLDEDRNVLRGRLNCPVEASHQMIGDSLTWMIKADVIKMERAVLFHQARFSALPQNLRWMSGRKEGKNLYFFPLPRYWGVVTTERERFYKNFSEALREFEKFETAQMFEYRAFVNSYRVPLMATMYGNGNRLVSSVLPESFIEQMTPAFQEKAREHNEAFLKETDVSRYVKKGERTVADIKHLFHRLANAYEVDENGSNTAKIMLLDESFETDGSMETIFMSYLLENQGVQFHEGLISIDIGKKISGKNWNGLVDAVNFKLASDESAFTTTLVH